MVAQVHKNTNAPLIPIVCDVIFCMRKKHFNRRVLRVFQGGQDLFDPQIVLSAAKGNFGVKKVDNVFCPQKKIIARIFKIGGALIVKNHSGAKIFQQSVNVKAFWKQNTYIICGKNRTYTETAYCNLKNKEQGSFK